MDWELLALEMVSLTLQIKGRKPEEKAVSLLNNDWDQACNKTTLWQKNYNNFTYELHGMEFTKDDWEYLLFQRWKAILVSIELSVEVQDTKLKLVQSYYSININYFVKNWVVLMPKRLQNFEADPCGMIFVSFYWWPFNIAIQFNENVFSKKHEVYKNLSWETFPENWCSLLFSNIHASVLCKFCANYKLSGALPWRVTRTNVKIMHL